MNFPNTDTPVTGAAGVVILGMGRSGTSAVTSMFSGSGFFVAEDDDLMPATKSNPAGHWENMRICQANESILDQLGGSWFDPPSVATQLLARGWATPVLRIEIDSLIKQAAGKPIAVKDPRISAMMALWCPIVTNQLHPVLVIRDPVEIALSLNHRDGTPLALALAAWELHMTTLLDQLHGQIVTVAPYARLIENSQLGASIVAHATAHIDSNRTTYVQPAHAPSAIQRELRHNRAVVGNHDEQLTDHQLALRQSLLSLPLGDQLIVVPPELRPYSHAD